MKRAIIAFAAMLGLLASGLLASGLALADPREDADAAWRAGDYAKAVVLFRKAAEQGDPIAMTSLARQYQQGNGTAKNLDEAMRWNRRAAEIFRARALQGDVDAQYSLGSLYDGNTPGMPNDPAEQLKWVAAAADHDHVIAQTRLGVLYSNGLGVPKDNAKAYTWWLIASGPHPRELSDRDKRFADIARRNAADMKASLTPAQLAQAQKAASAWKPRQP